MRKKDLVSAAYCRIGDAFLAALVRRKGNFEETTRLGNPVWQNVLDLWALREAISEIKPALALETGTHRGGLALFYASLFDLMGQGRVVTVDTESRHSRTHARVDFLSGDSTSNETLEGMRAASRAADGPVLVVLDSDHVRDHVARELDLYAPLVTSGSLILVQDGIIDVLPRFRAARPGPLAAIDDFLVQHNEFYIDQAFERRFLATHHPHGWLRRR